MTKSPGPASTRKTSMASRREAGGSMYFVYVLKSNGYNKSYIGITNDLNRRLSEHNSGLHTYTKKYMPWTIVHSESTIDRVAARKKEKYLKSAAGRRWLHSNIFV